MNIFVLLGFVFFIVASGEGVSFTGDKAKVTAGATKFVWKAVNQGADSVNVHFTCNKNNQIRVAFIGPGRADFVKGGIAIIKMSTANVPPSGKGYQEFIYTAVLHGDQRILNINKRNIKFFMKELNTLRAQTFKNREAGIAEYQEKINYCADLPKDRQQKCYSSSSGYQPEEPRIFIEVTVDKPRPVEEGKDGSGGSSGDGGGGSGGASSGGALAVGSSGAGGVSGRKEVSYFNSSDLKGLSQLSCYK